MQRSKIQNLTLTALMAAILCMAGPIVIPVGMVPMSITNMAVYLAIILLDKKKATISVAIYLLIGFVGIPVFAGFTAGVGKILGPTGGYLIGYLALSWISGMILEWIDTISFVGKYANILQNAKQMFALMIGNVMLYFFGTLWLMYQSQLTFLAALSMGVFPFVFFDMIKIIVAVYLGNEVKRRLQSIV